MRHIHNKPVKTALLYAQMNHIVSGEVRKVLQTKLVWHIQGSHWPLRREKATDPKRPQNCIHMKSPTRLRQMRQPRTPHHVELKSRLKIWVPSHTPSRLAVFGLRNTLWGVQSRQEQVQSSSKVVILNRLDVIFRGKKMPNMLDPYWKIVFYQPPPPINKMPKTTETLTGAVNWLRR